MKICPNCSFHLNDDTVICPSCGKNTAEEVVQNFSENTNEAVASDAIPEKPAFAAEEQSAHAAAPQQQPPVYGAPQQGYVQQPPVYGAPQQGYAQQPPVYGAPQQGYMPQQSPVYGAPQQPPVYGAPQQPPVYRSNPNGFAGQQTVAPDPHDKTAEFDPNDIAANKTNAVLAYIGILVLVPLLSAKQSPFAQFHANQGVVLWIAGMISAILCFIPVIGIIGYAGAVAVIVFSVLGIVNSASGTAKELPIISSINIVK